MAIPESQLATWSSQGSIQQSASTYATIKLALESKDTTSRARTIRFSCKAHTGTVRTSTRIATWMSSSRSTRSFSTI